METMESRDLGFLTVFIALICGICVWTTRTIMKPYLNTHELDTYRRGVVLGIWTEGDNRLVLGHDQTALLVGKSRIINIRKINKNGQPITTVCSLDDLVAENSIKDDIHFSNELRGKFGIEPALPGESINTSFYIIIEWTDYAADNSDENTTKLESALMYDPVHCCLVYNDDYFFKKDESLLKTSWDEVSRTVHFLKF